MADFLLTGSAYYLNAEVSNVRLNKTKKNLWSRIWKNRLVYLLFIPTALNFAIFHYAPMYGLRIAFQKFIPGLPLEMAKWVGVKNFTDFFASFYAGEVISNTLILSFYLILFGFPLPIILALTFNEVRNMGFKRVVQTISYVPYFISSVIIVGLVVLMLNPTDGIVNNLIRAFGGESISFLERPQWFRFVYVAMSLWKGTGFGAIVYLSAIAGVDQELYEAAIIDGAGRMKRMWHITVKGIMPTIMIMLIMRVGTILNIDWMEVLLMQNKVNMQVSEIIQTFIYKRGLINAEYGYATAVGLMMSTLSMTLMIGTNQVVKKATDGDMSLF